MSDSSGILNAELGAGIRCCSMCDGGGGSCKLVCVICGCVSCCVTGWTGRINVVGGGTAACGTVLGAAIDEPNSMGVGKIFSAIVMFVCGFGVIFVVLMVTLVVVSVCVLVASVFVCGGEVGVEGDSGSGFFLGLPLFLLK